MRRRINWTIWMLCVLTISFGLLSTGLFAMVWAYGGLTMYEDNLTILTIESILAVAITAFGFYSLRKSIR